MKKYILKNSLLAVAVSAFALVGCTAGGDDFDYHKNVAYITGTETTPMVKFVVEDTPATYAVSASTSNKVDKEVKVTFAVDNSLVEEYNKANGTNYYAIPEGAVEVDGANATIEAGKTYSSACNVKVISTEEFKEGRTYVIPVTMKSVDGVDVLEPSRTVYLRIARVIQFTSLNISNTSMYSNFIFDDGLKQELNNFTYEVKFYSQQWHTIARMMSFTSADESRSSMLRFGENGMDVNCLQWVSPVGSIPSTTRFSTDRWYMLTLTYDGSTFTMYVDGVKDTAAGGDGKPVNFQRIELGMSWTSYPASQFFKGRLAEVRVWNRALGPSEIQANICGVDPASEGLVAYWKMNEGEGHIFHDATGHGYDMDWSNTCREIREGAGLTYNLDYSSFVGWDRDDKNKCNQ